MTIDHERTNKAMTLLLLLEELCKLLAEWVHPSSDQRGDIRHLSRDTTRSKS